MVVRQHFPKIGTWDEIIFLAKLGREEIFRDFWCPLGKVMLRWAACVCFCECQCTIWLEGSTRFSGQLGVFLVLNVEGSLEENKLS